MEPKHQLVILSLAVLLFTSVSSMSAGKDVVSKATLAQMDIIETSIDHTVEPCDDFFAYACSNWENQTAATGTSSSNHVIFEKKFIEAVENMLVNECPAKEQIKKQNQSFADKVLTFYHSCKNSGKFGLFNELKPGNDIEWPLVDDLNGKEPKNMEHFDLFSFLGQLFGYGFDNFLLNLSVRREPNGSLYIELDSPSEEEFGNFTTHYMLLSVGYDRKKDFDKVTKYVNEIKQTHAQWLATYKEYSAENSELFSYQQIKQLYPELAKFLELALPNQLKDDDVVAVSHIKYMDFLTKNEWQPEEIRKLCNYAMVLLYKYLIPHHFGECVAKVQSKMHFAVNYMYRQHYLTAEIKAVFNDLKEKIYKNLLEMVDENYSEFNAAQLKAVKDKLARTYVSIGNVPDITDDAMVDEFYRHMPDLDINNYTRNVLWSVKQQFLEKINCPEHMECLEDIGHGTYNVIENDLVIISLASLGPPMYDWTFDPIFAVSLMGIFIGHEYGHSIDTDSLMDPKLYESIYEEFEKHPNINATIECTNQQYLTEYLRQLEVDLMGARAAFRLYKTEYNIQPSFTETPWQQLFFLNYAQYFCKWKDWSGTVSEDTIRTNHVAMNMDEFAQAFKCQAGSKMNPVKKCLLY